MIKQGLIAALFAVSTFGFLNEDLFRINRLDEDVVGDGLTPMPGAAEIFINVKSLNTIVQDMSVLALPKILAGKSWSPDWSVSLGGVTMNVNQVNITSVHIQADFVNVGFVNNTDTVRVHYSEVEVDLALDVDLVDKLPFLPDLNITSLTLHNVTIQLDIGTTPADDQVHWSI